MFIADDGATGVIKHHETRRPVEAIDKRESDSDQATTDVETAFRKLLKNGNPFTVTDVAKLSRRSRAFIYNHFGDTIPAAAQRSQKKVTELANNAHDDQEASYRERARQAEALNKQLNTEVKQRDQRIRDLQAQLRDPEGALLSNKLVDANQTIRELLAKITKLERDRSKLQRQLDGSRANVARERARNVRRNQADTVITLPTTPSAIR